MSYRVLSRVLRGQSEKHAASQSTTPRQVNWNLPMLARLKLNQGA